MKRRRVLPESLAAAVRRADAMLPAIGLTRRVERLQDAVETIETRYEDLLSSRERALRQLRTENRRLKQQVRDLNLERAILQDVNRRVLLRPLQQRQVVDYVVSRYGLEKRQAKRMLGTSRKLISRGRSGKAGEEWQLSLQERAQLWVLQGYQQVNVVIQKQGWMVGRRLAYRIYIDEPRKQLRKQARKMVARKAGWLGRLRPKMSTPETGGSPA